jgi:hypothetical protein
MKNDKKSPLKAPPLRSPGQSIQDEINDFIDNKVMFPYLTAMMFAVLAMYEWIAAWRNLPRQPIIMTIMAVVMVGFAVIRIIRGRRTIAHLKQGRDGERAVGQFLEDLRPKGFYVFHDLLGEDFNIDHVLVGPKGLFTIETKTISKPKRGRAVVNYDGEQLIINGCTPDRNPVVQAKAQVNWLKDLLAEANLNIPIKPVVVYPGWYVENQGNAAKSPVWVLNPRALPRFIDNLPDQLSDSQIGLVKKMLTLHARKGC